MSGRLPGVVFLRGCPRSGTTLLANLLNENPGIGILSEQPLDDVAQRLLPLFWYQEALERESELLGGPAATRAPAAASYEPIDTLRRMRELHPYPTRERLGQILTAVVEASLDKRDLRIIGSKTPGHWSGPQTQLLRSAFERVRFVFMVRNPLDTINSMINRRNRARSGLDPSWPDKPVYDSIARYQEAVCLLLSCMRRFPDDTFLVGYEELHDDPERVLSALGAFLGVEIRDRSGSIGPPRAAENVLTASEEAEVRAAFGAAVAAWKGKRLTGPVTSLGNALDDCLRCIDPGKTYRCDAPVGDRGLLGTGWSGAHADGIRSDDASADLFFTVPLAGRYRVVLDVVAEGSRENGPARIALALQDARVEHRLRLGKHSRAASHLVELAPGRAQRALLECGASRLLLRRIRFERA